MDKRLFIHLSLDKPSAHEFTEYVGAAVTSATTGVSISQIYVLKFQLVGIFHFYKHKIYYFLLLFTTVYCILLEYIEYNTI